jgi:hypothetical protein
MSIFNPWVMFCIIFAVGAAGTGGYTKGVHSEQDRQKLVIAALNEEARQKEQALVAAVNTTATQLSKAQNDAKLLSQKRNADIESGTLRMRIPISAASSTVSTCASSTAPAGNSEQATAELDPKTLRDLIAITDQGDANTRQLNACIDAYNKLYQTMKEQK